MTGTIVDVTVPTKQFALQHTLSEFETVTFEVKQMVATTQDSLMPFMRIETTDCARLESAFATDDSVADFERIADFDTDCLYQLEWVERIDKRIRVLIDQKATILTATGKGDTWHLRLLFADHNAISRTNTSCKEHGIDFDVKNIHELSGQQCKRFGLTDSQQTALRLAAARGYYSIPRDVTAEDLAAELGITHQALSERLRRGHGSLVNHVLSNGGGTLELTELGQTERERETS
ncbi:helix-turn-helix domain-containing protein [Haladaptatus halobius]|uniref:helix-turn-helix domain-containing protein n=1 Tax=Haladaptatus halobius TaxID=2884875 RepID=UPI001D0B8E33|nr:helix-turn-helix domain-containing protein [Haladaptatus halobius]